MAYHRCRYKEAQSPYLFEYTNVVMSGASDTIITDIDWNENTFSGKKWVLEFSVDPFTSSSTRAALISTSTDNMNYFMRSRNFRQRINANESSVFSTSLYANDQIQIEYDGNGTAKLYVGGVLKATNSNHNPAYASGSGVNKIRIGARPDNSWPYTGTINYIRLKFID